MKYIKTFENNERQYRVDDTIIYWYMNHFKESEEKRIGTLFEVSPETNAVINKYPNDGKKYNFINDYQIIRLATPQDLVDFELNNDIEKYNL